MIGGIFHEGSGLGDQLMRYITVRTLAEDRNFAWEMRGWDHFKGKEMFLNFASYKHIGFAHAGLSKGGSSVLSTELTKHFIEKDVRDSQGLDIRSYDPEINFIEDNTIIDGSLEDDKYWGHNLVNINKWLAVEPLNVSDQVCIMGFRGGEYAGNPDLFLGPDYWNEAMARMGLKLFEIHTDDPQLARKLFPDLLVTENERISHSKHTNMGFNWRSARFAKHAIIPNSAFFIIPRLLKHLEDPTAVTIAPRYWARHNTKVWARPACYYRPFTYI